MLQLSRQTVRQYMTPRVDVAFIGLSAAKVAKPNRIVIDLPLGTATWHFTSIPKGSEETRSLRLRG